MLTPNLPAQWPRDPITHQSFVWILYYIDRCEWAENTALWLVLLPAFPLVLGSLLVVINSPLGAVDDLGS